MAEIPNSPRDPPEEASKHILFISQIIKLDSRLVFPYFNAETAWDLGCSIRLRLQTEFPDKACLVSITRPTEPAVPLFACATNDGTTVDNARWVARKRATVLRWGCSTWTMRVKFNGDQLRFRDHYLLGETAEQYAIHGGGVPIKVKGVDGIVAVAVVSGLKQEQDYMLIVEEIERALNEIEDST
ncbi:MAG: hypothetical protein M1834_000123 [Cirrosporium novae-zelandiae]|nr:MAG: hypothetical protein M1834_000123 [Cirrosporium novae-zelandiae]